jgi:hypothetical protein
MQRVTASQARFFELFGEPGHTEPKGREPTPRAQAGSAFV